MMTIPGAQGTGADEIEWNIGDTARSIACNRELRIHFYFNRDRLSRYWVDFFDACL